MPPDRDRYVDYWVVEGKNVVSSYGDAATARRKAAAEPGATVKHERVKIREDASNEQIRKAIRSHGGGNASGYSEQKGCPLTMLILLSPFLTLLVVCGVLVVT